MVTQTTSFLQETPRHRVSHSPTMDLFYNVCVTIRWGEPPKGFEPPTFSLQVRRTTVVLQRQILKVSGGRHTSGRRGDPPTCYSLVGTTGIEPVTFKI